MTNLFRFIVLFLFATAVSCSSGTLPTPSTSQMDNLNVNALDNGYAITFTSKFTFGDQVDYASDLNGSGHGKITNIDIDSNGVVRYTIQTSDSWQSGILEEEITVPD